MRNTCFAAALVAAFFVAGCAGGSTSISDRVADQVVYEADTRAERAVRAGGLLVGLSEVAAVTARWYEPQSAGSALLCLRQARGILQEMRNAESYWWFESDTHRIFLHCAGAISADLRAKISAALTPGVDLGAIREVVGQAAVARNVALDLRFVAGKVQDPAAAWPIYMARLEANMATIERLTGGAESGE